MTLMGCVIGILMAWKPDTYIGRFSVVRADNLWNRGWGIVIAVGCFLGFLATLRATVRRRQG